MKVKIQIKTFWGTVLFEAEKEDYTIKRALQDAVLQDAVLRGADLRDADLRGADLRDADLRRADLRGADLRDAVLRGADLRGADLRDAKNIPQSWINECSRDILYVLEHLKPEVTFLREQLIAGKVDGQRYVGDCACLLGTLAKADSSIDKVCAALPFYDKGTHNPGENFFLNIRPGDTPENSFFAAHALKLIDMVLGKTVEAKKRGRPHKAA